MKTGLFFLLLTLSVGLISGSVLGVDNGYVLISWLGYTLESSLAFFVLFTTALMLGLYVLLRLCLLMIGKDWRFNEWRANKRSQRARRQTTSGLLNLAQGQWKRAERLLTLNADDSDTPLINYLAAARAAAEQEHQEDAEKWLNAALRSTEGAELAVGVMHAELLSARGQKEQALAILLKLRHDHPKHAYTLKLLAKLYLELEDWKALHELIPLARKFARIPDDKLHELEEKVHLQMLERSIHGQTQKSKALEILQQNYHSYARSVRFSLPIAKRYIELLQELQAEGLAEQELRSILNNLWHADLVCLYGKVQGDDPGRQLLFAEKQLPERPNDPVLLLTLGRLAVRTGQDEKARDYLENGLRIRNLADLHIELAKLFLAQGDQSRACEHFQLAL